MPLNSSEEEEQQGLESFGGVIRRVTQTVKLRSVLPDPRCNTDVRVSGPHKALLADATERTTCIEASAILAQQTPLV